MLDWSSAVRRPTAYRVNRPGIFMGNFTSRSLIRYLIMLMLGLFGLFVILLTSMTTNRSGSGGGGLMSGDGGCEYVSSGDSYPYNATYPFTPPVHSQSNGDQFTTFRIAVITDLDWDSKSVDKKNTWFSYMRYGQLAYSPTSSSQRVSIKWDKETHKIKSTLAQGGRSMELSELAVFDGYLLSVDDRTGVVYRIMPDKVAVPWVVIPDGPGDVAKGFKGEWMAVKNHQLYVGGLGKEWTTVEGEFVNYHPMWIKVVHPNGNVRHVDWTGVYKKLRATIGIQWPGYMIHESGRWSEVHKKWIFLPRRVSNESYTEAADETRGSNYMLVADENFEDIQARRVGKLNPTRGFSSFQFVPGTQDGVMVALKSEEVNGVIKSYVTAFEFATGRLILEETELEGRFKFEGIEFV